MTTSKHDNAEFTLPAEAVGNFLADQAVSTSRHYYAAGDIDIEPVVLLLQRVSPGAYDGLASGELSADLEFKWTEKGLDKL